MVRILKVRRPLEPKTPRFGQAIGESKNAIAQRGKVVTRAKASVQRRMWTGRRDPLDQTGATENVNTRPVVDQFTNNPNVNYDPSRAPGSVTERTGDPQPPRNQRTGHGNVVSSPSKLRGAKIRRR